MDRGGCIYIMTNHLRTTFYIGVTSDLQARIQEHQVGKNPKSFTNRYKLHHCIYYEMHPSIEEAIAREKEIKKWRRGKKVDLINTLNPKWDDLSAEIQRW
ncbi:GIY-YIG nuclease family protein [Pedobacter frigoris]|uniref:GIY-YIG nuclease family protein n=1 Tax=Pedobacter frigoris TaxID=2571272 RepID=UPI00292F5B0F|nr:GIY-YIG nuclease family protein [Pedobacter frigoris]